jgi:internalin A
MARKKRSVWERLTGSLDIGCYISYSRQDGRNYAETLRKHLKALGVHVVWPEDDPAQGSQLVEAITAFMDRADVLILVGTSRALASQWVLREIEYFRHRGGPVVPIGFGDSFGDFEGIPVFLREIQWLREDSAALRTGPSPEVLDRLASVLDWVRPEGLRGLWKVTSARSHTEKRPLNEGKLIVVGRGEVGKTSLVKRLVENDFNGDESKTQGIRISNWFIPCEGDTFRLNIWDFGGQEIMHATHQFFLTEQSLYLLVLNGREGAEDIDAEYWLKHIESFGGESPVIVVQNKIAQHPFDLNYRGLLARYPQIRGFVKTDCRDQIGLPELRELVKEVVGGMPEVRMQFPADWFRVKERLEIMGDEFLSYQGFVELCADEGIDEESDRDKLGFVLHCLGIALNYRDDSRLRETSVLKPEWVTHGIYNILNAKQLAERQGELELKDLQEVLQKKRYPLDKHLFLLELMRKFSLCFSFQDEADRYLVPELLGKEEPEDVATFQPEHCLNFEYHYGVLPEGLLPRFIVRTHILSRGQQRWRSGVVLSHENCRALVKTEPIERRIVVRVRGGDAVGRRSLLAIIRYDLDRIHTEFKDRLDAQAKVPLAEFPAFSVDYKKLVAFERQGVKEFPEFIGQQVVVVNVNELRNGVDFDEQRGDSFDALNRAKSLFFSYSHMDEGLRDELETHLKLLQRQRIISTWHDRKILSGNEWDREIDKRLERAAIILLLISADFIASDYCWDKEVKRALQRHEAKEAIVVPVLLRSCDFKGAPFGKLQGLPTGMTAVTAWQDRDAAWTDVATGIRAIAERLPSSGLAPRL